ncbi:MAG: hypothetical protein FK734_10240 [Asgard group archaeon]|nr:hypothetical protein [Asgard group archaeon]
MGQTKSKLFNKNLREQLIIFSILAALPFIYYVIRRVLLITDASLEHYGSGGFLNRSIQLTNQDILANFTISFDILQVIALIGLFVVFIFMLKVTETKNRKYIITIIVLFGIMAVLALTRLVVIHLDPENYALIGDYGEVLTYYEYAFYIYSTDTLRIVITLLLIISMIVFIKYQNVTTKKEQKYKNTLPIFLTIFLLIYIAIVIVGNYYYTEISSKMDTSLYFLNYIIQIFMHISTTFAFLGFAKKY